MRNPTSITNTLILRLVLVALACIAAISIMLKKMDEPVEQVTATSTTPVRDEKSFVLNPTMEEEYQDWVKYVDIMEGDTIHIRVFKPVYPDPGNDFSNQ